MPTTRVKQDVRKDAWNWWNACNKISYGTDWQQRISKQLRKKIVGKTKTEAFVFLMPYLKHAYEKERIGKKKKELEDILIRQQRQIFSRMIKVTGKPICRKTLTCFLTTFPRAPYDFQRGYIWIPVIWPKETYVRTFIHELLHFQTYAYWQERCLRKLSQKEFEDLKEALTVILNEEFLDLIVWPDKGYPVHQDFRKQLRKFWMTEKNFDKLVKYGVKIYPQFNRQPATDRTPSILTLKQSK